MLRKLLFACCALVAFCGVALIVAWITIAQAAKNKTHSEWPSESEVVSYHSTVGNWHRGQFR